LKPETFDATDMQQARATILNDKGPGADTEARRANETT
jgi:hypothetical protein